MLDQDTGGAIRAAGRYDIYFGVGDAAERIAGGQYAGGELNYLAVKEPLVAQYLAGATRASVSPPASQR